MTGVLTMTNEPHIIFSITQYWLHAPFPKFCLTCFGVICFVGWVLLFYLARGWRVGVGSRVWPGSPDLPASMPGVLPKCFNSFPFLIPKKQFKVLIHHPKTSQLSLSLLCSLFSSQPLPSSAFHTHLPTHPMPPSPPGFSTFFSLLPAQLNLEMRCKWFLSWVPFPKCSKPLFPLSNVIIPTNKHQPQWKATLPIT